MARTVLVADDSPTIRKIVDLCLSSREIRVLGAADGSAAVEILKSSVPSLVLADAVMPGPDGYELCERIKEGEFGAAPPVILLADVIEPLDTRRASACGADGQIAKPFEAATLQCLVCEQLGIDPPPAARRSAPPMTAYTSETAGARIGAGSDLLPPPAKTLVTPGSASPGLLSEADLEALARRVIGMMSEDLVREVAWEVVPEMSEILIKERLQNR